MGREPGLWPRVPAALGQEGLSSSPQGHLGLCLLPAQASSKRHLSLRVGEGCLGCRESRRGGSRLGRQLTLLCVGQSLPASPQGSPTTCCPAGAGVPLWTKNMKSGFAGVSPDRRMPQCHSPPGASSPVSPLKLHLVDTFPSTRGGWLCPQRMLDGCCSRRPGLHGLANWQGRVPLALRDNPFRLHQRAGDTSWGRWVPRGHPSPLRCSSCKPADFSHLDI